MYFRYSFIFVIPSKMEHSTSRHCIFGQEREESHLPALFACTFLSSHTESFPFFSHTIGNPHKE